MRAEQIRKTYGRRVVLHTEPMTLEQGRIYAVLGANGSGKSTLAKILAGLEKPDSGERPLPSAVRVGYLPQRPYAFRMSTERNLLTASDDRERMKELIQSLNLTELSRAKSHHLSGGETARMALARVLMKPFDLLILDEPSASMDMESAYLAEKAIADYRDRYNTAVFLITHSTGQARRLGEELIFLSEGKIAESGDLAVHLREPSSAEFRRFLEFQQ